MSFELAARAMQRDSIRHFGGGATCTLMRRMTLQKNGTSDILLEVNGNQVAGAATLSLKLAGLRAGSIPKGAKFTIAGNATEYTLTAAASVVTTGQISVAITPVLAADAADGADVTWTQPYGAWTPTFSRVARQLVEATEGAGTSVSETINLEALDGMPEPMPGDLIQFSSTNRKAVLGAPAVNPGSVVGRYVVHLGEVRA